MLASFDEDLGQYCGSQIEHQGTPVNKSKFESSIFKFQGNLVDICETLQETTHFIALDDMVGEEKKNRSSPLFSSVWESAN